jgi:DNA topoisomerase I
MSKVLVIVESPAKAKTISKFLGDDYVVKASIGHIRDLPRSASDIPEAKKKEAWSELGVDIEGGYEPLYVVPAEKKEQVRSLKAALKGADSLYLATDEDREGESISWHLREVLKPKVPVHRLVFHEITKGAIARALGNLREINFSLVKAQETRRIVDRLYGYKVSPLLWDKLRKRNLSAGRVQSVAVRIIVQRERARLRFVSAGWWNIEAKLTSPVGNVQAKLISWEGKQIAEGSNFNDQGELKKDVRVLDEQSAASIVETLRGTDAVLLSLQKRNFTEKPPSPFITSSLQQEAVRKLRWTAKRTMSVAQRLYESGWITYMRTDSTVLSKQAVDAARSLIEKRYGKEFLPDKPRTYSSSTKNAQEAHEAIRPAGDSFRTPQEASSELLADEFKLYELIWKRTMASQMENARGSRVRAIFESGSAQLSASGKSYTFHGFRRAYVEGLDSPQENLDSKEKILPPLSEGDALSVEDLEAKGHNTKPPARFTEATLVRKLEEKGIGRPSTYASIIDNILSRGYIFRKGTALVPSFTAFVVMDLLEEHLTWLVDYDFTAKMETRLDEIARGEAESESILSRFYQGSSGLHKSLEQAYSVIDRSKCWVELGKSPEGESIEIRCGRHGEYLQLGDVIAYIPTETPPDELDIARALELIEEKKKGPKILGEDSESRPVYLRKGPYGYYVQQGDPVEVPKKRGKGTKTIKPKQASLLRGMSPADIGLEEAISLLSLPRLLGKIEVGGEEKDVLAANGRYGPYLKCGSDSRSLPPTISVLEVVLEQAIELFSKPKARSSGTLKELGTDESTGREITLKQGRYGPYVTDGKTNASIPKSMEADAVDIKSALILIRKRESEPKKKRAPRKKTKK